MSKLGIIALIGLVSMLTFVDCKKEGPAEKAGKKLDETGKSIQDSAERALDSLEKSKKK